MGKHFSPAEAVIRLRKMKTDLKRELRNAEKENLKDGLQIAKVYSTGTYSLETLRKMGHPYAKRHPRPPADPGIINYQSGLFKRSWKKTLGTWSGNKLHSEIRNNAPYAGFLDKGTDLMIRRPIRDRVIKALAPRRMIRLHKAVKKALTP
jgi:hypothetical protein